MHIEHLAVWVLDLEQMRTFYEYYFGATANAEYINPTKGFSSYFLTFPDGGPRLELMQMPGISSLPDASTQYMGLTHLAFSVGSEQNVNALTERFRADGYQIAGEPRRTGDGYYESVILDPEGNRLEVTI